MNHLIPRPMFTRRAGQSVVEYMLAVSVLAVGLAAGFVIFSDHISMMFDNVRTTVQAPYP